MNYKLVFYFYYVTEVELKEIIVTDNRHFSNRKQRLTLLHINTYFHSLDHCVICFKSNLWTSIVCVYGNVIELLRACRETIREKKIEKAYGSRKYKCM